MSSQPQETYTIMTQGIDKTQLIAYYERSFTSKPFSRPSSSCFMNVCYAGKTVREKMQQRGFKYCLMKHGFQNKQEDSDLGRKENLDNL